jgi:phage tail sheath protein FI
MSTTNPNFKNRKTPGVYITELDAFPTSVVGVQTAVPAFIGYTRQATINGKSVLLQPVAISSMADFEQVFGTEFNVLFDINPLTTSPLSGVTPDITVDGQSFEVVPAQQPQFNLYYSMRLFYANGGSTCYVVSTGDYSSAVSLQPLLDGLNAISYQVGPTMLVVPDAVLLPADVNTHGSVPTSQDFNKVTEAMMDQCVKLQDRVAILDVYGSTAVTQSNVDLTLDACITQFQQSVTNASPSYGMAYFPFLNTSIVQSADINYTNFDPQQQPSEVLSPLSPPNNTQLQYILTLFNQAQYPNTTDKNGNTVLNPTQQKVQVYIDQINQHDAHNSPAVQTLNNTLTSALPAYLHLLALVALKEGVLPPSGAMAGIFTLNDQTRGVWNAPANMPLVSTTSLTVNLSDAQQGDLNVPIDGKAVDVIRYFSGRGPVVWGARTLDGNSQDWRYIQVRRTIIYIEQSIRNAINQFVFAANDARTWVAVTQMVSGFLQGLWSQGGLMGDKASDAFTVLCGVPQTMTGTDILNGYMVVQVTLQMVHPAEFIELTFKQTMQGA